MGRDRKISSLTLGLLLYRAISAGLAVLALLTLAAYAARLHWTLELASNIHPQALLAAAMLTGLAALINRWRAAGFALALGVLHAWPVAPYWLAPAPPPTSAELALRVMTVNLRAEKSDPAIFQAILAEERPDLLLLTGLPVDLPALLGLMSTHWPYLLTDRSGSGNDLALYSRWPFSNVRWERNWLMLPVEGLGNRRIEYPVLTTDLCIEPPHCLTVIGAHAARPYRKRHGMQNWQLDRIAEQAQKAHYPVIALGDFNLTPWSPRFRDLLARSRLSDAMLGSPARASYGHSCLWLGLPVDHVLIGSALTAIRFWPSRSFGSIHRAVLADLILHAQKQDRTILTDG